MALVSSRSLKTRSLRGRTRLFWAFAIPAIAVTITVNLSVLDGGVDLTSESDIREAIPSIDHDTSLPLINLLSHARMSISRKDMESIPKWSEVVSRFGERPRILGLETCSTFRGLNPQKDLRLIAPAGIFNSGTNLLYRLLAKNCKTSDFNQNSYSRTGIDWQVNWGKNFMIWNIGRAQDNWDS